MDDLDPTVALALELTDFARTFRQIGEAFIAAGNADPKLTGPERAGVATRELVDRYMVIDQLAISQALAAIVGYLAQRTGRTPREVHESLFKTAPSDAWWHAKLADRERGDP